MYPQKTAQLPRGIRNSNPGNIRKNSIRWQGMESVQTDAYFVQFISPIYGFRAMAKILTKYASRGLTSVRQIISIYSPSYENHTETYISFVAEKLGVPDDQPLNIEDNLFPLIKAITTFENGTKYENYYSDNLIQKGIALA